MMNKASCVLENLEENKFPFDQNTKQETEIKIIHKSSRKTMFVLTNSIYIKICIEK